MKVWLLDNPHRVALTLAPDTELDAKRLAEEKAELAAVAAGLDDAGRAAIEADLGLLRQFQDTPDSPEDLARIPSLALADLPRDETPIPQQARQADDVEILLHPLETSGIAYLDLAFPLTSVPDRLVPLVPLFGRALLELGTERFDAVQLRQELELRYAALVATGEDDEETLLNVLRRAHHAEVFRTLARDVEGAISVEQVADDLSLLAETMLGITVDWCWQRLKQKHREQPAIGIIAYGKLGGKELGYGGDLDIVFVYDDEDENASEIYAAFVRKLISWMTVKTGEGDLFEIDMALRPNGSSGLLVISFAAYSNYQQQRGSNTAWLWEHQAMTRARFIWGSEAVQTQFNAVRTEVLTAPRDVAALKREIVAMRKRMAEANKAPPNKFDVKYSAGGMIDAEFAVQYLVLAHAREHAELLDNVGNIALLKRCDAAGLLPAPLGSEAADAYRQLRRYQHKARLDERPTQTEPEQLAQERATIEKLWQVVFA